jgi:hypothetical protein
MIPLTTRRNRSSSIAETYPVGKVRPLRPLRADDSARSSDPLVGDLVDEDTDQGCDGL